MGKLKPMRCPESAGGCGSVCVEVGHALGYPKPTGGPWPTGKEAKEHRYACPGCGREWIYQTKWKDIYPVPESAQFRIEVVDGEEIIQTQAPDLLKHWGLPPGQRANLTPDDVVNLDRKAARRSYEKAKKKGKGRTC